MGHNKLVITQLKNQMSMLKLEVEGMLNSEERLHSLLNTTTRFYLERIRQMSSELPEEIVCLEEASRNLINNLPPARKCLKASNIENIETRLFCK